MKIIYGRKDNLHLQTNCREDHILKHCKKNVASEGKSHATGVYMEICRFTAQDSDTAVAVKANMKCYAETNTVCARFAERSVFQLLASVS